MKHNFDYIIIGAGINALSCIHGISQLNNRKKIALITGSPNQKIMHSHPKIFKDQINSRHNIFSHKSNILGKYLPGIISGLNYFWGEQCNSEEVLNKRKYQNDYKFFSSFLELDEGKSLTKIKEMGHHININKVDSAITGDKSKKKFKLYFEENCKIFFNEAISIDKKRVLLNDKRSVYGNKILLCAGLVGTTNLLKSICNDINFRYYDHSPKIDFVYSKDINQAHNRNKIYSIVGKIYDKKNNIKYYLKFYPLKSLELLFFLKKIKHLLPKFLLNYKFKINNFYFIQKWDNNSIKEFRNDKIFFKHKFNHKQNFQKLDIIYKKLKIFKIFSFRSKEDNFHFHNLRIVKNRKIVSIESFLKRYNPNVHCLSLLTEKSISCLPPTFMNCIKTALKIKKI